jgi:1-acyl-sn-glycerol-3-phosphate acyltransferase
MLRAFSPYQQSTVFSMIVEIFDMPSFFVIFVWYNVPYIKLRIRGYGMDDTIRFDMRRPPMRQKTYLKVLTWIFSFPVVWLRRLKINRVNMKGLKPPYLLLCTHKSFVDFMVTTACTFPHRANYVVAIDGFIGREKLLR